MGTDGEDALGSVRVEGLEPSDAVLQDSVEYEAGHITSDDLYTRTLERVQSKGKG